MSNNPCRAFKGTFCDKCDEDIGEDDFVYLHDGQWYCPSCAKEIDISCDCGNYKKPDYNKCFICWKEKVH